MKIIPYGKQSISKRDIKSVIDVLNSDFITQGPVTPKFEKIISEYCGSKYTVAVNSATSALHVACLALGLGKGDRLWTSPNSFVASANCGLYCNAKIDFVDIDLQTYNMCVQKLEKKLVEAKKNGKLPKVIVVVHFSGQCTSMKKIKHLSKEYGFKIIEDASHAIGGKYLKTKIGSSKYSDITVFSFHPVKIITTAEGGAAVTNNYKLAKMMYQFRTHGITKDKIDFTEKNDSPWYYEQNLVGYNYRLTDIHAALGISQIKRIDDFVKKRHLLAERYNKKLNKKFIITPYQSSRCYSAYHLYVIRVKVSKNINPRNGLFNLLKSNNIGVNVHYIPIHLQPIYRKMGFSKGDFPCAEQYYEEAISIPLYPDLRVSEQNKVIDLINNYFK